MVWPVACQVSEALELHTVPSVTARCGDTITLTCEANSSRQMDIKSFMWMNNGKTLCKYEEGNPQMNGPCEFSPPNKLILTLTNVMPSMEFEHLCKIRTTAGVKESKTLVSVDYCVRNSNYSMNSTHTTCWFFNITPIQVISWFQGDTVIESGLTEFSSEDSLLYDLHSTAQLEDRNISRPYRCCLMTTHDETPLCQTLEMTSSGSMLKEQWICVMLEILLVKFLT
ncbi:uncharacterized protein LOC117831991 isoform X2 [Notolabrus celidotus]|uniref:uncharacterized protein LOC117831991 isoform X2 n=1 Tax=Notolabrus celidotus TaxID=1203425 RepID=UPI001490087F|nr:uncharacterized protein LOC117831991 isoform X2 [Notolabrus celidotus]